MQIKKIITFVLSGISPVLNNGAIVLAVVFLSKALELSTTELGQANVIFLITAFVMGLGGFGLTEAFYKYAKTKSDNIWLAIVQNLKLNILAFLVIIMSNIANNWLNLNSFLDYFLLFCLFISFSYSFVCSLFLSLEQRIKYSFFQLSHPILLILALSTFRDLRFNSITTFVLASLVFSLCLPLLIMLIYLIKQKKLDFKKHKLDEQINNFVRGNIILLFSIMTIMQTDGLFIVNLLSDGVYQNGIFKSIAQIGKLAMAMGVFVGIPVAPILANLFEQKNYIQIKKTYWTANFIMAFVSCLLVTIASIWHKEIISILFSQSDIQQNSYLLPLLLGFFCVSGMMYITYYTWQMAGKIKLVWQATLIQAIVFVVGMIYFVPQGLLYTAVFMLTLQLITWLVWLRYFWITTF
jgi:O-antigen/teichoic acid export membrane protein